MINDLSNLLCPENYIKERAGINHRNIKKISYPSKSVGVERSANVVLPFDYDPDKKYPVMYVLHGIFGNEDTMLYAEDSRVPEIVGNMAIERITSQKILVFINMYATADKDMAPGFSPEAIAPYDFFINDLVDDLIPYIEENFSCLSDRENRGLLGFSMGGKESLYIALERSDIFGYVAAAAPAPGLIPAKDWAMEHPGMYNPEDSLRLAHPDMPPCMLVCGGEKDSVVGKFPESYHDILTKMGIDHVWYEAPEAEHNEGIVQSATYNFMKMWKN